MFLLVGLGNPGKKYENTRHNVGFNAVDAFARTHGVAAFSGKFKGSYARGAVAGCDVVLLKPDTFMNLSGESVAPAASFFHVEPASIIVVHDELDVPFGEVRLKVGGGHGGHNGLRSMVGCLSTPDFVRVRVGIGRPPPGFKGDVADYVLGSWDTMESAVLGDVVQRVVQMLERTLEKGAAVTMNEMHGKAAPKKA